MTSRSSRPPPGTSMICSTPTATLTRPTGRRRGLALGEQGPDGMSRLSGWIDPETRCYVEAVTAAVRPGRHLPDATLAEVADERSAATTASSSA